MGRLVLEEMLVEACGQVEGCDERIDVRCVSLLTTSIDDVEDG
jgi:tRNA G37 N-methylase TrmD